LGIASILIFLESVRLWENLTDKAAEPADVNPFTDAEDADVLKAYNIGIAQGVGAESFAPDALLTREQASTMLMRVYEAAYMPGLTPAEDADRAHEYTKPEAFADDAKISPWAKAGVYFMAANSIVGGMGNGDFSPQGNTTIEQAVAISVRMSDKSKG
jgi:hypothetical protein